MTACLQFFIICDWNFGVSLTDDPPPPPPQPSNAQVNVTSSTVHLSAKSALFEIATSVHSNHTTEK